MNAFRSLKGFNYRVWAGGALVSNVGTWMQRVAQDWLVLTGLTHHNATAVGVVMALQFGPQILLLPVTGWVADRFDRRKVLYATQGAQGILAAALGLLTLTGAVQLWQVYLLAGLLGVVSSFDTPVRQSFVSELVGEGDLSNAVALNSTSFNAGRTIGPAAAGVLIAAVGTGWVFLINAASFMAVLASLAFIRKSELYRNQASRRVRGGQLEGFRYIWRRPDLLAVLVMLFIFVTFGLNFPIYISTMAVRIFHAGSGQFGLLTSAMAMGSVTGALMVARRSAPRIANILAAAGVFAVGCGLAALAPSYGLFGLALFFVGIAAQTFTTSSNSLVQITTEPAMRGRVIAIMLGLAMGGTPLGAPVMGWVADRLGPRWALVGGALASLAAGLVGLVYLFRHEGLAIGLQAGRLRIRLNGVEPAIPQAGAEPEAT